MWFDTTLCLFETSLVLFDNVVVSSFDLVLPATLGFDFLSNSGDDDEDDDDLVLLSDADVVAL